MSKNIREYREHYIDKTGKSFQDYHVKIGDRHRWGTLSEIKKDIDDYLSNIKIPFEPNK